MKKTLSISSANLLCLLTILLVQVLGSLMQRADLSWGLIATEFLLILAPTLLFLRWKNIPLLEGLRLRPIPLGTALISLLLGVSIFLFSILIEGIMAQLTGMTSVPLPANMLPHGLFQSTLYFLALAVAAPLCEEALFRGAIQGAYEARRPPRFAITLTALLFAFYHMRLSGLPALLPMAFVLGYVAWRTQSILPGVLVHFASNGTSAVNQLYAIQTGKALPFISLNSAVLGLLLAAVLIKAIQRLHPAPGVTSGLDETSQAGQQKPKTAIVFATYWPLVVAGLIYLGIAGITLSMQLSTLGKPQTLSYHPQRSGPPVESRYEITNRAGEVVGEMTCRLSTDRPQVRLECQRSIQGYLIKVSVGTFSEETSTTTWKAAWDINSWDLQTFEFELQTVSGIHYRTELIDGQLVRIDEASTHATPYLPGTLLENEWPWRENDLNADPGTSWRVSFGYLSTWHEKLGATAPLIKTERLVEYPAETLDTPAGSFTAWKVKVGKQTVWYGRDDPNYPRPLKIDDDMRIYSLTN